METTPQTTSIHEIIRKARRVGVLGAGVSGKGAARLLEKLDKQIFMFDDRDRSDDAEINALAAEGMIANWGEIGENDFADREFDNLDLFVVSPGVPRDHWLRRLAEKHAIPTIGEFELAWQYARRGRTAAVTGTNGKTTVTLLIDSIARAAGLPSVAAGNIGLAWSEAVVQCEGRIPETLFVVEASSFQLEDTVEFAPEVAVLLNITPDHFDRHKAMDEYAAAKARIAANQTADHALIVNQDDAACLRIAQTSRARIKSFSLERPVDDGVWLDDDRLSISAPGAKPKTLIELERLPVFGMHNVANCMAAACAALALGIPRAKIAEALASFKGAPHRIEFVASVGGVDYFNDSKATNVDALVKAVQSFHAPVHLIAGGRDKNSPFASVRNRIAPRLAAAYLIGEAADAIREAWAGAVECSDCVTLEKALEAASEKARPGEVVLLSPGCASFDQFQSYAQRGEKFRRWVHLHEARAKHPE